MRHRRIALVVMVAVLATPGVASASIWQSRPTLVKPSPDPVATIGSVPDDAEDGGVVDTLFTLDGKLVKQTVKTQKKGELAASDDATPTTPQDAAVSAGGGTKMLADAGRTGSGSNTTATGSGCRTLDVFKTNYTTLGYVAYKYHLQKYWCWYLTSAYNVNVSDYFTNVDGNFVPRSRLQGNNYFYYWFTWNASSGHASQYQYRVENCVLKYGCIGNTYPWIHEYAHGDGTYTWSRGQ